MAGILQSAISIFFKSALQANPLYQVYTAAKELTNPSQNWTQNILNAGIIASGGTNLPYTMATQFGRDYPKLAAIADDPITAILNALKKKMAIRQVLTVGKNI